MAPLGCSSSWRWVVKGDRMRGMSWELLGAASRHPCLDFARKMDARRIILGFGLHAVWGGTAESPQPGPALWWEDPLRDEVLG